MVGGDELRIDVRVARGRHALCTTPAAGKAYRTHRRAGDAAQTLQVDAGGALEWLPQETIVYDGAIASCETRVELGARGALRRRRDDLLRAAGARASASRAAPAGSGSRALTRGGSAAVRRARPLRRRRAGAAAPAGGCGGATVMALLVACAGAGRGDRRRAARAGASDGDGLARRARCWETGPPSSAATLGAQRRAGPRVPARGLARWCAPR